MNIIKNCRHGTIIFNPNDEWIGKSLLHYGEFSEFEVKVFEKAVRKGFVVLDIGANIGTHTVVFSRLVGSTGAVISFEPQKPIYYMLCGNVAINSLVNVDCVNAAAGKSPGSIKVPKIDYSQPGSFGSLSLLPKYPANAVMEVVRLFSVDELNLSKCDFIKIDIEGMELEAISGAVKTIEKYQPILCVENDRKDRSAALIAKLHELQYRVFDWKPPLYNPSNYLQNQIDLLCLEIDGEKPGYKTPVSSFNLFCFHKDKEPPVDLDWFLMKEISQE